MRNITTYEYARNAEFRVDANDCLIGVTICGPGEQRKYYAVKAAGNENQLTKEIMEDALDIMKVNEGGYEELTKYIIPKTREVLKNT